MIRRAAGIRRLILSGASCLPECGAKWQAPGAGSRPQNRRTRWAWDRILGLAVGVALFLSVFSVLSPVDTDITVYWKAAHRVFDQGANPYLRQPDDVLPFTYPPTALFLLYPLSVLDLEQSATLTLTVNLLLALLLMTLIVSDLSHDGTDRRLAFWGPVYVAAFGGLYLTIVFCQLNLILLLFLWLYWRQVRRSQPTWSSGAALALGCVAKPHYGLLVLGAGPKPGYRLIAGASIAGVVLLWASLALAPDGSWHTWIDGVLGETSYTALPAGHSSIAAPWNRAIPGLVARFLVPNKFRDPLVDSPVTSRYISAALILLLLAVSVWALYRSMRRADRGPKDRDLELSLISVFVFLASPASWTHHLVMLLPASLVILRDGVLDRREPIASRLTAGLTLAVIAFTFDDLIPREIRTSSLAIMSLMTVAVVALWLLIVARLLRPQRSR